MKCLYPLVLLILIFPTQVLSADSVQIRTIVVTGNEAFSSDEILGLMQSQVGRDYDPELLRQDFERIAELYRSTDFSLVELMRSSLYS